VLKPTIKSNETLPTNSKSDAQDNASTPMMNDSIPTKNISTTTKSSTSDKYKSQPNQIQEIIIV